ncbi:MAG: electron transport complex subunit RsxC [Vulcanimicrobiota bacterium]
MSTKAFHGGVHPPEHKEETQAEAIQILEIPKKVTIPMSMHLGVPAQPLVKVNDEVHTGQKIGESDAFITAVIHSPITGKVVAIEDAPHPVQGICKAVIIEGADVDIPYYKAPTRHWEEMPPKEIVALIKEAGIVGLGGAAFPTHIKLTPPEGKHVDSLIINGAECEPYLTSDDRLMNERADDLIEGIRILKRATGATEVILALEDNKYLANKSLDKALEGRTNIITKKVLKTQYPQGSEKQLIQAITGKEVPSGGLPIDVGVVVQNVGTAIAVYEAVTIGKPLIERVITVSGDAVKNPGNFLARFGIPFRTLIEAAGGFKGDAGKIIMGGPMMGIAQYTLDVPVIKGVSGILVLSEEATELPEPENCIRCSFCVKACPQKLMPQMLGKLAQKEKWTEMKYNYNMMDCMECGSCTYTCPARIPLVQLIRLGKYKTRMLKI